MKKILSIIAIVILTGMITIGLNANDEDPVVTGEEDSFLSAEGNQDGFGRGFRGAGFHRQAMLEELNLTDEQQAKLDALHSEHQKEKITLAAKVKVLAIELKDLMEKQGNDQAVMAKHAELQEQRALMAEMQLRNRLEMRSIFTAEQWEKACDLKGQRMGRKGGFRGRGMHDGDGFGGRGFRHHNGPRRNFGPMTPNSGSNQ